MNLWHRYTTQLGMMSMANHLPRILIDLAEDSESRDSACPVCDGMGYLVDGSVRYTCVECDGVGRVRLPGDAHARRQLFEVIELIGPSEADR
jgi:hypothetical protein